MLPLRADGLLLVLLVPGILGSILQQYFAAIKQFFPKSDNLNFTGIVSGYGYKSEEHTVLTEDGYLLTLFRITKGIKCHERNKRTPVLMMHGLLQDANCWIDAGPGGGLAYLTSDACFDTWIGNVRGTYYSRRHAHLDPDRDKQFWQFSVDEIGLYDVPALIDYILKETAQPQLNYIGFSQGAGTFFIMCSEKPGYCDKSRVLIALAPATRHLNTKSPGFRLVTLIVKSLKKTLDSLGIWEVFARNLPLNEFLSNFCQNDQAIVFCDLILASFDAPHPGSITDRTAKLVARHILAGTSTKNIARYGQSVLSEKFDKYDYGDSQNLQLYGSTRPPLYNLSAVSVPTLVIYGKNDGIVDEKDVKWAVSKLPNVKEVIAVRDRLWTHLDMSYSQYVEVTIFPSIKKYLMMSDQHNL